MCTALSVTVKNNYFGRNLDYYISFGEKIIITPRNFVFEFRNGIRITNHHAIIGMGIVCDNYPLYFDATNDKGLSIAGLNFPNYAKYNENKSLADNVASFEVIPWILSQCSNIHEAKSFISRINITNTPFNNELKTSPLHWIISDKNDSLTLEQTEVGIKVYDNPAGVLTNNPPFDFQLFNLNNYMNVSSEEAHNMFHETLNLIPYSHGMGGIGLPGDLSSASRFVKTCFIKLNAKYGEAEEEIVNTFFHILYSVYQQKGCVRVGDGYEITHYTSCCNTDRGIYYYTTYNNSIINAIDMNKEDLENHNLITYELSKVQKIITQNR